VADLTGTVENGQIAKTWKVVYTPDEDDGSTSAQELKEKGYTLPEYHFVAEYRDVVSEVSPVLEVKGWGKRKLINQKTGKALTNTRFTIITSEHKIITGTTESDGTLAIKDTLIGKYKLFV
jgi:hypothetical protein